MAVAVKSNPGARPGDTPTNPTLLSLLGVVYVVICLALLFKVVPELWWTVWNSIDVAGVQFVRFPVVGGTLLILFSLSLGWAMLSLAARVLGEKPPPGVKAGVFVGFVSLLLIVLLTRWLSIYIEQFAYSGALTPMTGAILTGVTGGLLVLIFLRLLSQPWARANLVQLESMGWFTFVPYKPTQGLRVRRGTIFGILLLVAAGVYTMMTHNTLRSMGPDWSLNIPFTGTIAIEAAGDARSEIAALPAEMKANVQIRYPGASELRLRSGQVVQLETYRSQFLKVLEKLYPAGAQSFEGADQLEATAFLDKVNRFLYSEIQDVLEAKNEKNEPLLRADTVRRLRALDNETYLENLLPLIESVRRELAVARKSTDVEEDTAFLNLPTAVLLVDRFAMKEVEARLDPQEKVFLLSAGDAAELRDKENKVVSRSDFDDAVSRIKGDNLGEIPPESRPLQLAYGPPVYASITLLPSLQYTVPLLLILGALWLSWRLVNVPAFADFLIATDGEMNKVSWSTQKKLVQDTIVVLITVFLMAVFLFAVDYAWKLVLQPLGVLHIPQVSQEQQQQIEQKKW
jgi:preprotein translocase SecE subunit